MLIDIDVQVAVTKTEFIVRKKVKFALQQATTAQRGSRGIALLFL
jgi:hypothetical protein